MGDILTVRQALSQLSALLQRFRDGSTEPVAIGSHRRREAVLVPAALWDSLVGERRRGAELTDASLRIEGLTRSDGAREISERYVKGEIDVDEMVRQTIALHA